MRDGVIENILIAGDFNGRLDKKATRLKIEKNGCGRRKTKDKVENKEGRILVDLIEEQGWEILNGNKEGDEEGEFTYIGPNGASVIDYAITNDAAWEDIEKFTIG